MSQFQFILAVTVLVLGGTIAFTFHQLREDTPDKRQAGTKPSQKGTQSVIRSSRPPSDVRSATSTRSARDLIAQVNLDRSYTANLQKEERAAVNGIIEQINRDSQRKLTSLINSHGLTPAQQDQVLPYIVAHHDQAHPALQVGDRSLPSIVSGSSLEESFYPILDSEQQNSLAEQALDDDA